MPPGRRAAGRGVQHPGGIRQIQYVDADGHRWHGDDLRTGERIDLCSPANRTCTVSSPGGSNYLA